MVEIRILGPLEIVENDRPVVVDAPKVRMLFAVLLLHRGEVVSTDRLIDALWGERASPTAAKTVHVYMSRLRMALGDGLLVTRGRGYVLQAGPGQTDVDRFEGLAARGREALARGDALTAAAVLREALAVWRGPALADFAYEPFAQAEIARLEGARLAVLEDRIDADLQSGEHAQLVGELAALVREHPLRERSRGQLMLALYRTGRQAEALEVYQQGRALLVEELGLEPGPALKTLQNHILEHADSLAPTGVHAQPAPEYRPTAPGPTGGAVPRPTTPLIGRDRDVGTIVQLFADPEVRLVTLTGPGGVGKTRLALGLAGELSDGYRDGTWWVPLAAVTDPSLVLPSIAQSLGARGELEEHLAGKRLLLLLDNLEQLLDCAPLIADLLSGLPELSMIATSRERLAISFEREFQVPPLDEAAAEELFVSRARQLEPSFEPDETVTEICQRLDRLPLALELASTRVKLMSTSQMLDRLERRLDLLSKGQRDAPDRQATMRATIGWSYDLLPEPEQALFRGLGVFAGSFELEAAEAVCGADFDGLQSLIEKSLLGRDGHGRFFLLELTREYALEQLDAAGEQAVLRRRHADWFMQLARRATDHLQSTEQGVWLSRLHADRDNFRAVLRWFSEQDLARGVELATTLASLWEMHGEVQELVAWFEQALAKPGLTDNRTRAVGLRMYGAGLVFMGQEVRASEPLKESLLIFRELGDRLGEATALRMLAMAAWAEGNNEQAIERSEAALAIYREENDRRGTAQSLANLGASLLEIGDGEHGTAMLDEARAIYSELGDRVALAGFLHTLGDLALDRSDPERSAGNYRQALELAIELRDERTEMYSVAGLACAAALRGDGRSAGRLWAIAEAAENRLRTRMLGVERARYEQIVTAVQDDHAFQAGYQAGRDIELAEAVRELCAT